MDNREIEIKIKLNNREALIKKVEALGARIVHEKTLSHDVMYDDGQGFFDKGRVLRLRTYGNGKNLLTYKEPNKTGNEHLLERTEIQTWVSDAPTTDQILQKLGFSPYRIKEKNAVHYDLDGFELEFHTLPFLGEFLEIEAEEERLKQILPRLGFSLQDGINRDYTDLFQDFCKANNLPINTPQTFDQERMFTPTPQQNL